LTVTDLAPPVTSSIQVAGLRPGSILGHPGGKGVVGRGVKKARFRSAFTLHITEK